jgi:hypothetical protein
MINLSSRDNKRLVSILMAFFVSFCLAMLIVGSTAQVLGGGGGGGGRGGGGRGGMGGGMGGMGGGMGGMGGGMGGMGGGMGGMGGGMGGMGGGMGGFGGGGPDQGGGRGGGGRSGGGRGGDMPQFPDSIMPVAPELPSQATQKPYILNMRVADNLVAANITDCPMQIALQELAERTGIVFEVRSQDNPAISIYQQQLSFKDAVQRIAPDHNIVFYYDDSTPERLIGASIFPRSRPIQQPGVVILGTGEVTKTNDEVDTPEQAIKVLAGGDARLSVKKVAVGVLIENKSDEAIKALTKSLSDPEPEIRKTVIEGFAHLKAREALPEIVKSLKDGNPGVRQSAVIAIMELGTAKNLKDVERLKADTDPSVAYFADKAIIKLSASAGK